MEPEKREVFILTAEQRTQGEGSAVALYGASKDGPVELVCDFKPYFYVAGGAELHPSLASFLAEEALSLANRPVRKLIFHSVAAAESAKGLLAGSGVPLYESDIRPRERFLMDRRINGGVIASGPAEERNGIIRYRNPSLAPARAHVPLTICSLDIETSISNGGVLSCAMHLSGAGRDVRHVFMIGEGRPSEELTFVPDERALLTKIVEWFRASDPDIVVGWNVIGFDLQVLIDRAQKNGVRLMLGRDSRTVSVSQMSGRFSRAYIPGRVVLDGPQLLRASFYTFESYSLENVAREVLGEGKLIANTPNKAWEIERLFSRDKEALAAYNLKDTVLVTRIFQKLGLLELTMRRTELSGMLLDQVGMSTAAFDHFYLPRLHDAGYAGPDIADIGDVRPAMGGYVMDPVAGIYTDIIALDFQSLYPSIIRTFNIDPLSRARSDGEHISTPAGFRFSRKPSILPPFIGELMVERGHAKSTGDRALSQAIKILMNSFYGVMGSAGSRLYHPDLPAAITSTGQWLLLESRKRIEELGHRVLYGDTDSLFVELGEKPPPGEIAAKGAALAAELTAWWAERLDREFGVPSHLKLDFKRHYLKFLVPAARGSEGGAKKRYAGLVLEEEREEIEFVGLEVVRSDSTPLARDFQVELYRRIFKGEAVDEWIRSFIADVKSGRLDDKLVYRKRLHKPIAEYGKSPPPYVRAAMQLPKPSREVRYVMTLTGPVPEELNPANPDYEHYIDRQIRPVADSILELLGTSFKDIVSMQLKLF